jgi:hypothetical protein
MNSSINQDLRKLIVEQMAKFEADLSSDTPWKEWYRDNHMRFTNMTDKELIEHADLHFVGNIADEFDKKIEEAKVEMAFEEVVLNAKPPMSRDEAMAVLGFFIGRIGGGYHTDNQLKDYINGATRLPTFSKDELDRYQPLHDEMFKVLGNDSYVMGLTIFDKALGIK